MTATSQTRLLSPAQVAEILGVTTSTLCRLRQQGLGPKVVWVTDHTPRYREDQLFEFIEERGA